MVLKSPSLLTKVCSGTAGYGTNAWAVGHSFADQPTLTPVVYDPSAPAGQRWSRDGLNPSTVPRMYHSSATLLPDGMFFAILLLKTAETFARIRHRIRIQSE